jgi:tetratricopeptide (TPR) repeat protein
MLNLQVERLRKLPQHADETWQAALFRMPTWVEDDDGKPTRPWTALCISTRTGMVWLADPRSSAERSPRLVLDSVGGLATGKQGGYRPGRLEVNQTEVAAELRPILADIGVQVVEQPELPDLEDARQEMTKYFLEGREDPAALRVDGVTIDHLRAFAEAAKEFHEAAPWRHLSDEDLLEIVSPKPEKGLGFATVMGSGGREFGLGLFESRKQYDRMFEVDDPMSFIARRGVWSFTLVQMMDLPLGDADAWEDHQLPTVGDHVYPLLVRFGPGTEVRRPTPQQWAFVEGLLRALARTTEAEMDSGRWSKAVETIDGPAEYVLALPALLEPVEPKRSLPKKGVPDRRMMERAFVDIERATRDMEFSSTEEYQRFLDEHFTGKAVPHQAGRTPLERAQDLAYEATEARGRRQLQLLRKALEICPDCADAYVLLAERERGPERARELYARGMAAGERALGPRTFEKDAGHFWGILETRPYMRARFGLAQCCEASDQLDEAIGHYEELLRLNPRDNQGVRYRLAGCLVRAKRLDELEELLSRHDDASPHWLFLRALAAYATEGDTPKARGHLAAAHKANRHVRKYLLGNAPLPEDLPAAFHFGGDDEAVIVASEMIDDWEAVPGALDWLDANTKSRSRQRRRRRK